MELFPANAIPLVAWDTLGDPVARVIGMEFVTKEDVGDFIAAAVPPEHANERMPAASMVIVDQSEKALREGWFFLEFDGRKIARKSTDVPAGAKIIGRIAYVSHPV